MSSPRRDIHNASAGDATVADHSMPLKGIVICCTSVPDEKRTALAVVAEQMGAVVRADLTVEVTHLVVGDYDTPKYKFVAKLRPDVRPMTMEWIEAVRELWINDEELDVEVLERQYTLPTLASLKISMTGCDDPAERQEIAEKIKVNGAIYDGNLTKTITHLISFRTDGSKYKAAKNWGLRIVSIEWLNDSLDRGMILDEQYYDPSLPHEERGKGAWNKDIPKLNPSKKRTRESMIASEEGKRKLRRTASMKLSNQSQSLWGDIVSGSSAVQVTRSGVWDTTTENPPHAQNEATQRIDEGTSHAAAPAASIVQEPHHAASGIFSDCCFWNHAFSSKHTRLLANHLVERDGEVFQSEEELVASSISSPYKRHYMVVPYDLPATKYPKLLEAGSQIQIVTDFWVERCLHQKKYMEPSEHVIGRPFPVFPIEGFSELNISSAAFVGIDVLHVKKAVNLLGSSYGEYLTPQSSVLVTKSLVSLRKDKLEHAQEWKVPIVTADWLWDSIVAGTRLPFKKYRIRAAKQPASAPAATKESLFGSNSDSDSARAEAARSNSKSSTLPSRSSTRPPSAANIDDTAFDPEAPTHDVKEEQDSLRQHTPPINDLTQTTFPPKSEPLAELHHNSPSKTHSAKTPSTNTPSTNQSTHVDKQEEPSPNHAAISDLLAKSKRPTSSESIQMKRQRQPRKQIMGRAMSNVSAASSVDSTATTGNPVQYPREGVPEVDRFMNLHGSGQTETEESVPPATQLGYEDPESEEYRARVKAIMEGREAEAMKPRMPKERSATIGDLGKLGPAARTRRKERVESEATSTRRGLR